MSQITVYKLDENGEEVWRYQGRILERGETYVKLEAHFNHDDNQDEMDLDFATFKRGDRFVETYYEDRWYNVFAVYGGDGERLKGWYCNVCRPAQVADTAVSYDDLALDVWVEPNGDILILDKDEFEALALTPRERTAAQQALQTLLYRARQGQLPK